MSIFLRRALSYRNVLLLRSSPLLSRELRQCNPEPPHKEDESAASTVEILPNMGPTIKANATSHMEAAIAALTAELSKLRTGRAAPGMLDHIIVETGGVKLPLHQIAAVSVIDSKTLSINPFDSTAISSLETAIVESPLGLNPKVDGDRLIAAFCKVVTKSSEDGKQSIRRTRQKFGRFAAQLNRFLVSFTGNGYENYPKDELKRWEKEVDELTKKFVKTAVDLCKAKEKEISSG
ncbi:ribosome-recycling factor [Pyrus ussuriensis x Pyrus communis]|uniref:Ribosome-recycling factor, chloroplastic n=1 Tax=Pyrus ussuriensis x Pyrus communis TaxID=2448454 RepID=A0A5N5GF02_9ROSA|nr:ribosome-recycling factor [Pyrus ussuriensis x Pyrus communis]